MKKENRISKVTKTIIKDLKGERVVYQDSKNGKIIIPENKKDDGRINEDKNLTFNLICKIFVVIFIINFSLFSYCTFYKNRNYIEWLKDLSKSTVHIFNQNQINKQVALIKERNVNYQQKRKDLYSSKRKPT